MQKEQWVTISGPYVRYSSLLSRLASFGFRVSSFLVRPLVPRTSLKRVKRTSLGVCSLDDVSLKMFSGLKLGNVDMKARTAETKRMLRL